MNVGKVKVVPASQEVIDPFRMESGMNDLDWYKEGGGSRECAIVSSGTGFHA